VPKNIPLREATISRGLETEPVDTDDIKELIGIEMAPLQAINVHDFTAVDNEIYVKRPKGKAVILV
jgi:hypothetical protein